MTRYEPRTMGTARNRPGAARGQAYRDRIEALLRAHDPTARPLTAKDVCTKLQLPIAIRTVQHHLGIIRAR